MTRSTITSCVVSKLPIEDGLSGRTSSQIAGDEEAGFFQRVFSVVRLRCMEKGGKIKLDANRTQSSFREDPETQGILTAHVRTTGTGSKWCMDRAKNCRGARGFSR